MTAVTGIAFRDGRLRYKWKGAPSPGRLHRALGERDLGEQRPHAGEAARTRRGQPPFARDAGLVEEEHALSPLEADGLRHDLTMVVGGIDEGDGTATDGGDDLDEA